MEYFGNILKIQIADTGKGIAKKTINEFLNLGSQLKKEAGALDFPL